MNKDENIEFNGSEDESPFMRYLREHGEKLEPNDERAIRLNRMFRNMYEKSRTIGEWLICGENGSGMAVLAHEQTGEIIQMCLN